MAVALISGTYRLDDDETINFLNAATGTTFRIDQAEIESVDVETDEATGERSLVVVVGPKG